MLPINFSYFNFKLVWLYYSAVVFKMYTKVHEVFLGCTKLLGYAKLIKGCTKFLDQHKNFFSFVIIFI